MNDFPGKICPYCKTKLEQEDETVICSDCDMPHHKDCWIQNQGCTTFGCLGTISAPNRREKHEEAWDLFFTEEQTEKNRNWIFCTKCGRKNNETSNFCDRCGYPLMSTPSPEDGVWRDSFRNHGNMDIEVQQLIGANVEYYAPEFRKRREENKQISWNWAAFLMAPFWMIYRKLYGYGGVFLGVILVMALVAPGILWPVIIGGCLLSGIFANGIYGKVIEGKAIEAKAMIGLYKEQYIGKYGGVNMMAAVLTAVGWGLLVLFLSVS